MAKVQALAQFNKINKLFITVLGMVEDLSMLNNTHYLYKEVEIDVDQERIEGNYDNFQIVPINSGPLLITEGTLNALAREKIVEVYSLETQLSIIAETLERIADSVGVECEQLKDMNDFIQEVKRANQIRKDFYSTNSDYQYQSTDDVQNLLNQKYEGGIREYEGTVASI